ncbi:MAG: glycine/sarcosine/betaine reductase complex component C subunit beta [Bacillota bacterium]
MSQPVIKGASYLLFHAPTVLLDHGTTQTLERAKNPGSEYLKKLPGHLRPFGEVVAYPPNQVFIGNLEPDALNEIAQPWYENGISKASREGRLGEILPEEELYAWMKIADAFDLVRLEEGFHSEMKDRLARHPLVSEDDLKRFGSGVPASEIESILKDGHAAEALRLGERLVGCVRRAHEQDENLSAHIMYENLVTKASGVVALKRLLAQTGIAPGEVEYIIEASEEACGDMNQRGGGNFAKAVGEIAGCVNATGSDVRSFCAAPAHALVNAAALVKSGIYRQVAVVAGGAVAKLGMNGRDHVNKDMPALEDCVGAFAILVSENDGQSPIIRTDCIGRHLIGSGSSPQAVMQAIVTDPLDRVGLKITDIDKYSPEMQNPEITVPAGAGDVPKANFKMIGALGVKRGDLQREQLNDFVEKHGLPGYAPTQGHIPSGVPFVGLAREQIMAGKMKRAMIIGKGSLFLARMTNQFDGVSFVMEANSGETEATAAVSRQEIKKIVADALKNLASSLLEE